MTAVRIMYPLVSETRIRVGVAEDVMECFGGVPQEAQRMEEFESKTWQENPKTVVDESVVSSGEH